MIPTEEIVGTLFREIRESRGMSIHEAAIRCNCPKTAIAQVEAGTSFPSYRTMMRLAEGYDVDPGQFFIKRGKQKTLDGESVDQFSLVSLNELSVSLNLPERVLMSRVSSGKFPPPDFFWPVIKWRRREIAIWKASQKTGEKPQRQVRK